LGKAPKLFGVAGRTEIAALWKGRRRTPGIEGGQGHPAGPSRLGTQQGRGTRPLAGERKVRGRILRIQLESAPGGKLTKVNEAPSIGEEERPPHREHEKKRLIKVFFLLDKGSGGWNLKQGDANGSEGKHRFNERHVRDAVQKVRQKVSLYYL